MKRRMAAAIAADSAKVLCLTPTPGKSPCRIDGWKYRAVRAAILAALRTNPGGLRFLDLPEQVGAHLAPADRERLGSLSWYTTTVKLDLEVRGEIVRLPGTPQRLTLAAEMSSCPP